MTERILADALVVLHALFVAFVLVGGVLVLLRPALAFVHLPAAAWAAWVEFTGTICPLTPLENHWRQGAGAAGYEGGFVEHYLIPTLYPAGLTPRLQVALGVAVVMVNAAVYGFAWWRAHRRGGVRARKMSAAESDLRDNRERSR